MDLEVILASTSLCVVFCFVHRKIHNRQIAVLLRISVIHVIVNACIMGLDSLRMGYHIYTFSKSRLDIDKRSGVNTALYILWTLVYTMAVGVSAVIQAVLCIQTLTGRNACIKSCCNGHCCVPNEDWYSVIVGRKDTSTATNPASSRVSQPSYTHFTIQYTGEFTQITGSVRSTSTSDGESEKSQLIE